ncbi:MAG TPA: TetR family transcriptional regulator C-terminal domain-containing protein, partial [Ktedonobacterales bacterium]|nr:TetR family transcriptional regulator C-terminal domain-containing protein [Ktedonobacterales bacterium]
QEHLVSFLERGVRDGTFRADLDPQVASWGLIAFIQGCVMQGIIDPDGFPTERVHIEIERWLVGYAGPRPTDGK